MFFLEKAKIFIEDFGQSVHVTEVLPDYIKLKNKLRSAQQQISNIRKSDSAYKNRDSVYGECEPHVKALEEVVSEFDLAKPEIAKKDDQKKQAELKASRRFWLQITLSILAIIVAIIFGYLRIQ